LHASSIAINGSAIAFLGMSGWGKSTLAEAFHIQGYNILTDDLLAIQMRTGHPIVLPGFPQTKLWPDVATSLGYSVENLPRIHSYSEKRVHCLNEAFSQTACALKCLYVLADGCQHKIEVLTLRDALLELLKHAHGVTVLKIPDLAESNFSQCTDLVKHVPICRLKRPRSLSQLSNSVRLVEHHLTQTMC
jgi:dephospho-CoA kinase